MKDNIDNEHAIVLQSISVACKQIASLVQRAGLAGMTGLAGEQNVQGEDQKKLDVISNEVFCDTLRLSGRTGVIASEEEDVPVAVEETYAGNYVCVFDPLDGSSNVAYGVSVGSIFSVFEYNKTTAKNDGEGNTRSPIEEVLKPQTGRNVMCAGYCVYGSSTDLVIATRKNTRVVGWTLDPFSKTYVKTRANISIPMRGKIYSINEGYEHKFSEGMKKYIRDCKDSPTMMARYVGSMVADVHRTLLAGGTFHYPLGKLRMLYECFPMAFVIEVAGGLSISDTGSNTLDSAVASIHERGAIHLGSKENMDDLKKCLGL